MSELVVQKLKELRKAVAADVGADTPESIDVLACTMTRVEGQDPIFLVAVVEKIEVTDRISDDSFHEIEPGVHVNAGRAQLGGITVVVDRSEEHAPWLFINREPGSGTKIETEGASS